jgi:hypothetical protein
MERKACLIIFIGFIFLFQISGCKDMEKQAVVFEPSKVDSKIYAGHLDTIEPQKATLNTKIHIGGWAADFKKMMPAKAVIVVIDGKQTFVSIQTGFTREDVAKAHKNENLLKSGWDGGFNAAIMGKGKHKLEFYALLDDGKFAPLDCKGEKFAELEVIE